MPARPKIGLSLTDLRMPARQAIVQAARIGYEAIQIDTVGTEFEPRQFGPTARRDLKHVVGEVNVRIASLRVDIGAGRLADLSRLDEAVDRSCLALQMARDVGAPIVVLEPGPVAPDQSQVVDALRMVAQVADATGTLLALLAGQIEPRRTREMIDALGSPLVRAAYDPAALMLSGYESLSAIDALADRIALAYVRDAIPSQASGSLIAGARLGREVALGEGRLDLAEYIGALHEASYFGPLIVSRQHAIDPLAELAAARRKIEAIA